MNARREASVVVLDCAAEDRPRLGRLEAALSTRICEGAPSGPEDTVERARGANVVATLYTYTGLPAEVLEQLPDLRLVVTRTAGYSHIDAVAAARLGIAVAAVPSAPTVAVAEYTLATIAAMGRQLPEAFESARHGRWDFTAFRGRDLCGQTLGVIGLGAIGARVTELARAFGMSVLGWSRRPKDLPGVEQVDLDELLTRSDVVSVNVALAPETEGLLDAKRLRRMRPGARLVNTARGPIVDLDAVCELLRSGHLSGACLDVLPQEPASSEQLAELAEVPNLLITPHISWHTEGTLARQFEGMTDKIIAFCDGRPIETVEVAANADK